MSIFLRQLWRQKPPPSVLLDWSNPFCSGLLAFWALNELGGGIARSATGCGSVEASTPQWSASGVTTNSTGSCFAASTLPGLITGPHSLYFDAVRLGNWGSSYGYHFGVADNNGNHQSALKSNGSFTSLQYFVNAGGLVSTSAVTPTIGVRTKFLGVFDGANIRLWTDGAVTADVATASSSVSVLANSVFCLGGHTTRFGNWQILSAGVWNRALYADEWHAFRLGNPWQIFQPSRRVLYSLPAAGGTTHTVDGIVSVTPSVQSSTALAFQHSASLTTVPSLSAASLLSFIHAGQIESALTLSAEAIFNGHTEHLISGVLSAGEPALSSVASSTITHTLTSLLSVGAPGLSASVLVGHPIDDPWMAQLGDYPEGTAGWAVHTILTLLTNIHPNMDIRLAIQTLLALGAGKATGGGSDRIVFRDLEDSRDAVSMYVDVSGNRTSTTVDLG